MNPIFISIQYTLPIIVNGIILKYLYRLDQIKCICSDIPEKKNLITAYWIFIAVSALQICNVQFFDETKINHISLTIATFYLIYNIYINVKSIQFVRKLKTLQCKCSENWKREFMYIMNILDISLYFLLLFSIIVLVLVFVILNKSKHFQNTIPNNMVISKNM